MAQLKDLVVAGDSRVIGNEYVNGELTATLLKGRFFSTDNRSTMMTPGQYMVDGRGVVSEFKAAATVGLSGQSFFQVITFIRWGDSSGGYPVQIAIGDNNKVYLRPAQDASTWSSWRTIEGNLPHIYSGATEPAATLGVNGDIYIQKN